MRRLENKNIVKNHGEFKPFVQKNKEEVEHGSGGTADAAVLVALFVTASVLVFCFLVVTMVSSKPITIKVSAGCSTALCPDLVLLQHAFSLVLEKLSLSPLDTCYFSLE